MGRTHRLRKHTRPSFRRKPLAEALALVISLGIASTAPAATITVNSNADIIGDDGVCTLREAIISANLDSAAPFPGECLAGSGSDVIQFDPGVFPPSPNPAVTITLGPPGELGIDAYDPLQIHGSGNTTLVAAPGSRVFNITASGDAIIRELTISGGSVGAGSGGGIRVHNSLLRLENSTVSGNSVSDGSGGGIAVESGGTLYLVGSNVSGNTVSSYTPTPYTGTGGGISVMEGTLRVSDSTISGNQVQGYGTGAGGGIAFRSLVGALEITNTRIENNSAHFSGGGLAIDIPYLASGPLTVTASTISSNTAGQEGGGISLFGTPDTGYTAALSLIGSTIEGNNTDPYSASYGGGIAAIEGRIELTNSTVSGNRAGTVPGPYSPPPTGGGIWVSGSRTYLSHSTVSDNVGHGFVGIQSGPPGPSTFHFNKSILANSRDHLGNPMTDCNTGGAAYGSDNLIEDDGCLFNPPVDPMLAPLADNGGPTLTHALLSGSPAIDAVGCDWLAPPVPPRAPLPPDAYDQRGIARPQNGSNYFPSPFRCDLGAYERNNVINVNSTNTDVTDDGNCTLPEAIISANTGLPVDQCFPAAPLDAYGERDFGNPDGSLPDIITLYGETPLPTPDRIPYSFPGPTINFTAGYNGSNSALPAISSPITIEGNGTTLRGDFYSYYYGPPRAAGPLFRAFEITTGGNLTLDYLRLSNFGLGSGSGGAILTSGPLTLRESQVTGRLLSGNGGAISATGSVNLQGSRVQGYAENGNGGGLHLQGGSLAMSSSEVSGNAFYSGGGISGTNSSISIDHSAVRGSRAGHRGGGIYLDSSSLAVTNSLVGYNAAYRRYYAEGIGTLLDCNTSGQCRGGGIFLQNSTAMLANSTFSRNYSHLGGSAIHVGPNASLDLIHSTVSSNRSSSSSGAALYGEANGLTVLFNSVLGGNDYYSLYSETAVPGVDCSVQQGGVPPTGFYNLLEYSGNCAFSNGADGNLLGYAPLLGPLQINDGSYPYTGPGPIPPDIRTQSPLFGSPVIDAARYNECAASPVELEDQTGQPRPEPGGSSCDMGAVETQPLANLTAEHIRSPAGQVALIGGTFDWTMRVNNVGTDTATFADGERVLQGGYLGTTPSPVLPNGLDCQLGTPFPDTLSCYAVGTYSIDPGQNVEASFTATGATPGNYSISVIADPDELLAETSEKDNRGWMELEVRAESGSDPLTPDLLDFRVNLNNYPANTLPPGNLFRWGFRVRTDSGAVQGASIFPHGTTLLRADLPVGNTYDPPILRSSSNMTGELDCSVSLQSLTCTANGEIIMGPSAGMQVNLLGTLGPAGAYRVPEEGGVCAVDPDNVVDESDELNNDCSITLYSGALQPPTLCGGDNVTIPMNTIYPADGNPWVCTANLDLETENPVVLLDSGLLYYQAPQITLGPGFRVETGGEFHAGDSVIPVR